MHDGALSGQFLLEALLTTRQHRRDVPEVRMISEFALRWRVGLTARLELVLLELLQDDDELLLLKLILFFASWVLTRRLQLLIHQ